MVRQFLRVYVYNNKKELLTQLRCGITSNYLEDVDKYVREKVLEWKNKNNIIEDIKYDFEHIFSSSRS